MKQSKAATPNRGRSFDRKIEEKIYGRNACLAVFNERPGDIVKIYADIERKGSFSEMLRWAASEKKAYHLVEQDELAKVSESGHHEGICLVAKRRTQLPFEQVCKSLEKTSRCAVLFLDGVSNPHNLGAIIRNAAHFGVFAILTDSKAGATLSAAAQRVAEGGAEFVEFLRLEDSTTALKTLKNSGFKVVSSSPLAPKSLFQVGTISKAVFILGSEARGASKEIAALADITVSIPGSGSIQSLNVASASALILGEWFRQDSR